MAKTKKRAKKIAKVKCATCKATFDPIFEDRNDQAMHCSSTVTDAYLRGHYGSTVVDMELWTWINRPKNIKNGIMCDNCIQRYIDAGNLQLDSRCIW